MATVTPLIFTLLFLTFSGELLTLAKGQASGQGAWCVAKPSATNEELQENINFACTFVNCNVIQPGGACYNPQMLSSHASVAMNLYYQKQGRNYWNCDFKKSALISVIDPSYGDCKYEYAQ